MERRKNIIISIAFIVVILLAVILIFELNDYYDKPIVSEKIEMEPTDTAVELLKTKNISVSTSSADLGVNQSPSPAPSPKFNESSYSYLFEGNKGDNTSNIAGYFAHGAFAWYVPDWLVNNWKMKPFRTEGMIFSPKIRATPVAGQQEDFSDIEFDVSTSTEVNNAYNLYLTMLSSIPKDEIIISEVLLSKSMAGAISIQTENNTRIYHITAYNRDFKSISDLYFIDGKGKTLDLRFEAKTNIFSQFSDKIRDMVEGIGEVKSPEG